MGLSIFFGLIAGILLVLKILFSLFTFLDTVELKTTDYLFKIPLFKQKISDKIQLIGITDYDMYKFGDKIYMREEYYRLMEALNTFGAKFALFDILFQHRRDFDDMIALKFGEGAEAFISYNFFKNTLINEKRATIPQANISDDEETQDISFDEKLKIVTDNWSLPYKKEMGGEPIEASDINLPSGVLLQNAKGCGFINIENDADGTIRKIPLFYYFKENLYPHIDLLLICSYYGVSLKDLVIHFGDGIYFNPKRNGEGPKHIPIDSRGMMMINFKEGELFLNRSFYMYQVLNAYKNENPKERRDMQNLKESIVLIGETATASTDLRPIPLQNNYPMVALHANVIDTILTNSFPKPLPKYFAISIILILGLLSGYALSQTTYGRGILYIIAFILAYLLITYFYYISFLVVFPVTLPVSTILLSYIFITTYFLTFEERSKKRIKKLFGKYSSPEVVEELLKRPDDLSIWVNRQQVTTLFTDIRGFTPISEKYPPEQVVDVLNKYYDVVSSIVINNKGTVNKFIGDGVMAIFGAPLKSDDAEFNAILTAVEIQKRCNYYARKLKMILGLKLELELE